MSTNKIMTWDEENNLMVENMFKQSFKHMGQNSNEGFTLELYLTSDCDQKCEYCYLVNRGDKLYPSELRNPKTILHNMDLLFDYLIKNNLKPASIDFFTGEIWRSQFGLDALQKVLDYIKRVDTPPKTVMIPSNFSFILDEKYLLAIEHYIKSYEYYGSNLVFSCSNDGAIIDRETRPLNNSVLNQTKDTEEYYTKLFEWCTKYYYGFHPMVSAHAIEKWKDQYKWWIDKIVEYDMDYRKAIMFLEVRNDEWTEDKINTYLEYLDFAFNYTLERVYNNDFDEMLSDVSTLPLSHIDTSNVLRNYCMFGISANGKGMACSVDRAIIIRMGDLSWVPCHRTSYDKFIYGTFRVENDEITGMIGKNIPLLMSIHGVSYKGHMKCDTCAIGPICTRGCYGAQFEAHRELFYPCETVCDLFFAKDLYLYYKTKEMLKTHTTQQVHMVSWIDTMYDRYLSKIPKEVQDKWMPKIQHLIKSC